jgi:Tfp pilus assembly protein PilF
MINNKNKKIFISYSWFDKVIADQIDSDLNQFQFDIIRDVRDIKYKQNISEFMEKIRGADFAILLIGDKYLKSLNCMKEVLHLLKDRNYENKLLPVVNGNLNIYCSEDRLTYSKYWQDKKSNLEKQISCHPPTTIINEIAELKTINQITIDINDFLGYISKIKNITFTELKKEGYKSLLENIGYKNITHLIELLHISIIKDLEKKEVMLDDWIEKYNPISDFYSIKATTAKYKKEFLKAENNYKKALQMNPNNAIALNNYGWMLLQLQKDYDKAKDLFEQAIRNMPFLTEARINLGCLLVDHYKELESASKQYEEILNYNPTEDRAYNNLANIYKETHPDDKEKICQLFEKAIELNPEYIAAHLNYGSYLSEQIGDLKKAEIEFDIIDKINHDPKVKVLVDFLRGRIPMHTERIKKE